MRSSNDAHKNWPRRRLAQLLGDLAGKTVAIWGLTYKPGTDTLRRSSAIELCQWLLSQHVQVKAHDPAVKSLPKDLTAIQLCSLPIEAAEGADALVIATEWPYYRAVSLLEAIAVMRSSIILDANRFLVDQIKSISDVTYIAVGKAV